MNEVIRALKERRSIRSYRTEQVREEDLQQILEAATYAPSGMGAQPVILVAVQDPATIARLSQLNAAVMGTERDPFYGAPCVIVVLADPTYPTWVEDGSLVLGNLLNAAHAVELGSCWINRAREMFDTEEGKALLRQWGIPEHYRGIGCCILGYADEAPAPKERAANRIWKI